MTHAVIAMAMTALLFACATKPVEPAGAGAPPPADNNDPYENFNRAMFGFNDQLDRHIAMPIAKFYVHNVPSFARTGVHNFLTNLSLPVTLENDVLQGKPKRVGQSFGRLLINSSAGVGGLFDVATKIGIPDHQEDFGQTLGTYNTPEGPYIVLPLIGPAPPRDIAGRVADAFMDPIRYMRFHGKTEFSVSRGFLGILDERVQTLQATEEIQKTSVDYYATVRSLYRQHRNAEIHNGQTDLEDLPDVPEE